MQKNFWRKSGSIALSIMTCFSVWTTPVAAETGSNHINSNTVNTEASSSPAASTSNPSPSTGSTQTSPTETNKPVSSPSPSAKSTESTIPSVKISSLQESGESSSDYSTVTWKIDVNTDDPAADLAGITLTQTYDAKLLDLTKAELSTGTATDTDITGTQTDGTFAYTFAEGTIGAAKITLTMAVDSSAVDEALAALTDGSTSISTLAKVALTVDSTKINLTGDTLSTECSVSLQKSLTPALYSMPALGQGLLGAAEGKVTISGLIVYMDDNSAPTSRPVPELQLYNTADAKNPVATATIATSTEKYNGTDFTVESYTFPDVDAKDANGNDITYGIQNTSGTAEGYNLYYLDSNSTILSADENGLYSADANLIYSAKISISGIMKRDSASTDLTGVKLSVLDNQDVTPSFTIESGNTEGTWTADGLSKYDPATGAEKVWEVVASTLPDHYEVIYKNTDSKKTTSALDGGTILINAVPYTYTVNQQTYNYADKENVTYKLNTNAKVSYGTTVIDVTAGTAFTVPASITSFTISSVEKSVTVTLDDAATGCNVMSSKEQTMTADGTTSIDMISQKAVSITLKKRWLDGAKSDKDTTGMVLALEISTNGTDWVPLTVENMGTYGYSSMPEIPVHKGNDSEWSYSFTTLYNKILIDNIVTTIEYRLAETSVPSNYMMSYASNDSQELQNTLKNPYTATKKWADGKNSYKTRKEIADWISTLTVQKKAPDQTASSSVTLTTTDKAAEGYIEITDNGNQTWSISIPNALAFDENGSPYSYWILENTTNNQYAVAGTLNDGSYYVPTYLNQGNYASITTGLYSDGTLTNTLTNATTYSGTKVWKDDNTDTTIDERPNASFTLYRYPDDGSYNYVNASPVASVNTLTLTKDKVNKPTSYTIQFSSRTTPATPLPMYNADGYRYVYFAKETLSNGTNSYEKTFLNNGSLAGNNMFLFSNGELDNTITGTDNLSATKKWVATARQDVDAKVTLSLTQYDPTTGKTITLTDHPDQILTGFGAEITSKTANFDGLPKYNSSGLKYVYTISEKSLETETSKNNFQPATKNGDYFVTADGYRYRQDITEINGVYTITNTLVGNAEVVINKTFPNGLLASPTTLTYTVSRNGVPIGTVMHEYTGTVDGASYTPDPITIKDFSEFTENLTKETGLLPRYDANGAQYQYTVQETGIVSDKPYSTTENNSFAESTYAPTDPTYPNEKYLVATDAVSNSKPGEGLTIKVHKKWIDDGDTLYHQPVQVALQYTADGTTYTDVNTGTILISTDYVYISVPNTKPDGSTQTYIELYKTWVEKGHLLDKAGSFRVVETALGANSEYKVVADGDNSIKAFDGYSGHESGWSFVSTDDQNYDVSPTAEINENNSQDFTITNKRVGVVKINLTKTWVDGSGKYRPDSITYTVTASEAVFPVVGQENSKTKTYKIYNTDQWALETEWLQKYDYSTGAIITYSIEETSLNYTDATHAKYASYYSKSISHTGYTVGSHHTGDKDVYANKNSLSGSVNPYMNKYWKDRGGSVASLRPDIYPLLFRSYADSTGTTFYEEMSYQDRDWSVETVNDNWWKCYFVAQPRFAPEGYEYTYYVGEAYSSAILNDYQCSGAYADSPSDDGNFSETNADGSAKTKVTITVGGKTYPVAKLDNESKEAGTIVNKPISLRTVSGTKIWNNLPSDFNKKYLPDVTFALCRYKYQGDIKDAEEVFDSNKHLITTVMKSGSSSFLFDTEVDRYDADGKPYTYVVLETSPTHASVTYDITNEPTNGLVVTNSYKKDQGYEITFTKNWSSITQTSEALKLKPSVTFTLSRYLTDSDGNVITGTKSTNFAVAKSGTTENNTNGNTVTVTYDGTNPNTINWTHLAYYGPNGNPYQYQVKESNLPGYKVYDGQGNEITNNTVIVSSDAQSAPKTTGTANLTNKYGEVLGSIEVKKQWADTEHKDGKTSRPQQIALTLFRATRNTKEQIDVITLSDADKDTSNNSWIKKIDNLQIYAPDGEKYIYTITENTIIDGYITPVISPLNGVNATASTTTNTLTATNTENSFTLNKLGIDGKALSGSTFILTPAAGKSFADGYTEGISILDGTKASEIISGLFRPNTVYILEETIPAPGYTLTSKLYLKMDSAGQLSACDKESGEYKAVTDNNLDVTDEQNKFTLIKVDDKGELLAGATFTVTPKDGSFADGSNMPMKILNGENSETWTGKLVAGVTYTFEETLSPAGYVSMNSFTVQIDANGTVYITGSGVKVSGTTITAKNAPMTSSIEMTKLDYVTGKPIASSDTQKTVFLLSYTSPDKKVTSSSYLETDKDGKIQAKDLAKGTYVLTEYKADSNYMLPKSSDFAASFEVNDNCQGKTLTINSDSLGTATPFNLKVTDANSLLKPEGFSNVRVKGTVAVQKNGTDKKGLDGVTFEIRKSSDDSVVQTGTTANGGTLTFKDLAWDNYYLIETAAPAGYEAPDTKYPFTIEYGSLSVAFTDQTAITDSYTVFTLYKQDMNGNGLNGATFQLTGIFAGDKAESSQTLLNGTANTVILTNSLVAGNTYTLTETKAPDGCLRLKDAVKFTVNKVGTLKLADGTSSLVSLSKDEKGIVVKDDVIAVTMTKTDRVTKAAVSSKRGTRFRLSGRFVSMASPVVASDTELTELSKGQLIYTTDADIQTLKQDYESGTAPDPAVGNVYTLQEVEAPAGYTVEKEAIDFVVSDQGDVTVLDKDADVLTSVSGSDLNFSDTETIVSFKKVNEGGTVLTGAALEVDGTFADGTSSKQFTTSADLYTLKTMLIVGNTYQLKETAAPSGYYLQSEVAEFTMDDQGVITLTKDAGGAVKLDGTTLIMTDKKIPPTPESPVTPSVGGSVFTGDSSRASLYLGLLATGMIGLLGSAFWFLKKKRVH